MKRRFCEDERGTSYANQGFSVSDNQNSLTGAL